jgi:predicted ABC-type ATPase
MPIVVMLSGPNGAGKTTASKTLLQGPLKVDAFVNADIIAQGLGMPDAEETAFRAGRIMMERLEELESTGASFAFETTLASKTFVGRIARLKSKDYFYALLYLWLPSWADSIKRVRDRVRRGGHHVPDDTVRRRYHGGLRNFFRLYRPLADVWRFYDNSAASGPRLIASGVRELEMVRDNEVWRRIIREVDNDPKKPS